jgi:hypothetical protein
MLKLKMLALAVALAVLSPQARAATAVGVADTSNFMAGQSVSALFSNNNDWIQAMMNLRSVSGDVEFSVGGAYKFTVAGTNRAGFHIGPGLSLGTVAAGGESNFAFAIVGMFGGHYTLFERLLLSVDGGPILSVVDGNVDFGIAPMGTLLGLSIHYLF